jgi:rsbT antagonist protein RsbS
MARLLGAEVVVCGMHPAVALTLIEMGRGLIGVDATFNLNEGLSRLKKRIARRGDNALGEGDHDERSV